MALAVAGLPLARMIGHGRAFCRSSRRNELRFMVAAASQIAGPLHGLLIGFLGTGLYITVDRYEPNRIVAGVLKGLIVSLAILTVLADLRGLFN